MANPYQWNQPVPAVQFHGHQDLLETLMGHFAQKVALRIDGDPRRGKTSLLARLQAILEASFCEVVCLDTAALIRLHQDNPRQPFARLLSPLGSRAVLIDNLEQLASASSDMPHAVEASLRALVMDDVWVVACCRWDVLAPPQCQVLDFPFFTSLVLPLFTDDDVLQLLQQGALSKEEQQFVSLVCGNEPYLVQLLAGSMSDLPPRPGRARLSGNIALATIDQSLARAWRTQQPAERWVLLVMALTQVDVSIAVINAPRLNHSRKDVLLRLLCRLARFELHLLARAVLHQTFDAALSRVKSVVRLLQMLNGIHDIRRMLSLLLAWRPDLALFILGVAQKWDIHLRTPVNLQQMLQRGVIVTRKKHLQLRADVRVWWLCEQLTMVARGDISPVQWSQSLGLQPPGPSAMQHLVWRINRLEGQLSRGARPLIDAAIMGRGTGER